MPVVDLVSMYSDKKVGNSIFSILVLSFKSFFKNSRFTFSGTEHNFISINKINRKTNIKIKFKSKTKNNSVLIEDGFSGKVDIKIVGNNNHIYIGRNVVLDNVKIEILKSNSHVAIGERVSMGEGLLNVSDASGQPSLIFSGSENVKNENKPDPLPSSIVIGDGSLLSKGIMMMTSDGHPILNFNSKKINNHGAITIGKHVWIGTDVKILKNSSIGNGSIVGMGSIVTSKIPSNSISAGVPCKVIKSEYGFWARNVTEKSIALARKDLEMTTFN
ncbi:acyltransferase [Moritella sp. F3]|uniref:acyltransferase n=1 Tax=Moritella sp. F3 TaxID=2718882 RepID=UPI0018E16C61|nr:acyltransferase [Moritella sp. F3]GIC77284.1 hypothetical protein FMO001_20110 [Moritella sp. F1]GIC83188.1 hypothetical protein FMO003_34680 [Moritella sp. F3]